MHECGCELGYLPSMPRAGAILSASSLVPPYFSTLSHKRHDFRENVIEHKMRVYLKHFSFYEEIIKSQVSNFIKIRLVGVELFHADRRT